jgi:hypothetical protein
MEAYLGGSSSGVEGPFSSRAACEADLSRARHACTDSSPFIFTGSCYGNCGGGTSSSGDASSPNVPLGSTNLDGSSTGRPFFTPNRFSEFSDWIRESQERFQAYLAYNKYLRELFSAQRNKLKNQNNQVNRKNINDLPQVASHIAPKTNTEKKYLDDFDELSRNIMMIQLNVNIAHQYKDNEGVKSYLSSLWNSGNMDKVWQILIDQMRGEGKTQAEIDYFLNQKLIFETGAARGNYNFSQQQLNEFANLYGNSFQMRQQEYEALRKAAENGTQCDAEYMGDKAQFKSMDCSVWAMANGTQTDYYEMSAKFQQAIKDEAAREMKFRDNPDLQLNPDTTDPAQMEKAGLYLPEIMKLASDTGEITAYTKDQFEAAIDESGSPVIAGINNGDGGHVVVVTGVFQSGGQTYYSVMDSNAGQGACPTCQNNTTYWTQSDFNNVLVTGGFTVTPNE